MECHTHRVCCTGEDHTLSRTKFLWRLLHVCSTPRVLLEAVHLWPPRCLLHQGKNSSTSAGEGFVLLLRSLASSCRGFLLSLPGLSDFEYVTLLESSSLCCLELYSPLEGKDSMLDIIGQRYPCRCQVLKSNTFRRLLLQVAPPPASSSR